MSLSIILTSYNEVPLIFDSYEKIVSMMNLTKIEYELIIVDDGSRGEIQAQLEGYFQKKANTTLILSEVNEGRGSAVTKGLKRSTKRYAGFIDTDLEIPAYSLLNLYTVLKKGSFDAVIGRRFYLSAWNICYWPRIVCSRMYFLLANFLLGLNFLDTETGIKIFKKNKILPILDSVGSKGWFWDTEIIAEALKKNLKITQVPVFVSRKQKRSSVNILRDTKNYLRALREYREKRVAGNKRK